MVKAHETSMFIFRRDLRFQDNSGLINALSTSTKVIACFFLDPRLLTKKSSHHNAIQFMVEALKDLDGQLTQKRSHLFCFSGIPEEI
ncbi:MAG: deoxyribodipyrimidine photo-lyase, partial [Candidatus Thorarchaeota archaeon]